jgi:hypothetical protein
MLRESLQAHSEALRVGRLSVLLDLRQIFGPSQR